MELRQWNELPDRMRTREVRKYYNIIAQRRGWFRAKSGESVQRELAAVRDKLGLSQYVFPFERETSAEMNPDK